MSNVGMDKELKAKWVAALRSGKYQQARGHIGSPTKPCCLGVLSIVATGQLKCMAFEELLGGIDRGVLIRMNDEEKKSFPEIADYIESHL